MAEIRKRHKTSGKRDPKERIRGRSAKYERVTPIYVAPSNTQTYGRMGRAQKYFDAIASARPIPTSANAAGLEIDPLTTLCLFSPTQNSGNSGRNGRVVLAKSIYIRGAIEFNPVSGATSASQSRQLVTLYLVLAKKCNGTQPASEDVFQQLNTLAIGGSMLVRNMNNIMNYDVLKKWEIPASVDPIPYFDVESAAVRYYQPGQIVPFEWYVKKDMHFNFSSDDGTVGDLVDNSLHFMAVRADSGGATCEVTYNCRTQFVNLNG